MTIKENSPRRVSASAPPMDQSASEESQTIVSPSDSSPSVGTSGDGVAQKNRHLEWSSKLLFPHTEPQVTSYIRRAYE